MMRYHLVNFIRRLVWKYPGLYRPVGRIRRNTDVFDLDYDLSIEGYPRSANTFVLNLLRFTQPALRVRSHRHIPPHVIAAVQAGLPVLLLVRPPLDCVASYAILVSTPAIPQLAYYVAYHHALRPYLDRFVIADFASVTTDPKTVLRHFAQRYHLAFDLSFDLDEMSRRVFEKIDRDNTSHIGLLNERTVNRPTVARADKKSALVAEMQRPEHRRWLDQANALYAEFRAKAVGAPAVKPKNG